MGIFDYAKKHHPNSQICGLGGPRGIYTNSYVEITDEHMNSYRNQGGFDMICAGRDKIETPEQYENFLKFCRALHLDGLVVIRGDDSNTNACMLAEYFSQKEVLTKVIGAPKTIDGDLKDEIIEISFGFDSATKTYSEVIGNIAIDALSSKRYYHFIRVMGRSASHIALECALQTRSTWAFIGEEVKEKQMTLASSALIPSERHY
jgi:diphosphate--fructose-6-phosphate 1-phosphotransferase